MTLVVGAVKGEQGVLVADTKVTFGVRDGVIDDRERPPQDYASVHDANRAEYQNSVSKIVILDRHLAVGYAGDDPVAKIKHLVGLRGHSAEDVVDELAAVPDAHYVVLADGKSLRLWQVRQGAPEERTVTPGRAWALPDALTRPYSDGGAFPKLPDRWVVARLSPALEPGRRQVRAWVLDAAGAADSPATDPVVTPLSAWVAPPVAVAPDNALTALGHGDLAWAAYYDNVSNRCAFYDPLADGTDGSLAYVVCGWWARNGVDPLATLATLTGADWLTALADEFGWQLPADTDLPAAGPPTSTILHAAAFALSWPLSTPVGGLTESDARPDPDDVVVALGETMPQALAALAADPDETADVVTSIEAYLAQAQAESVGPDGAAQIGSAVHAMQFSADSAAQSSSSTIYQQSGFTGPASDGESATGDFTGAQRSLPRRFRQAEPVVVVQGVGRSFKHGADDRYSDDGRLTCRLTGQTVTDLGSTADDPGATPPASVLAGDLSGTAVPEEYAALLDEVAALDPGSVQSSAAAALRAGIWAADADAPADASGVLPSAISVTLPVRPWVPLRLDWAAQYMASPRGVHDWTLVDTDYVPAPGVDTSAGAQQPLTGRAMLSAGPAVTAGGAVAAAPPQGSAPSPEELADADLVGGALHGLTAGIRGDTDGQLVGSAARPALTDAPPSRAGCLRLTRLRVVDAYGQTRDLLGSSARSAADVTRLVISPQAQGTEAGTLLLRPRHTDTAQVQLRYVAGDDRRGVLNARVDADDTISPICGYLLPDFVDASVEAFDQSGANVGVLCPDPLSGTVYTPPPGSAQLLGRTTAQAPNGFLRALLDGVVAASQLPASTGDGPDQTALVALLATIDTVWYTIDFTQDAGDEHLALLVGHPIAVLRAELTLDAALDATGQTYEVRLGDIDRLQDGLVGYFVNDDYTTLHLPDAAVIDVIGAHPYLDATPLRIAGGVPVVLTLLVQPNCSVHVTTGLLPQKKIGMRRGWCKDALAAMTPSLRYGPVLINDRQVALPEPTDLHGTFSWIQRSTPGEWTEASVTAAAPTADLLRPSVAEGWLRLTLTDGGFDANPEPIMITTISDVDRGDLGQLTRIGGVDVDGNPWSLPIDDAVALTQSGMFVFQYQAWTGDIESGWNEATVDLVVTQNSAGDDILSPDPTNAAATALWGINTFPECGVKIDYLQGLSLYAFGGSAVLGVADWDSATDGTSVTVGPINSSNGLSQCWRTSDPSPYAFGPPVTARLVRTALALGWGQTRLLLSVDGASTADGAPVLLNHLPLDAGSMFNTITPQPHQAWLPVSAGLPDVPGSTTVFLQVQHSGMYLTRRTLDNGSIATVQSAYRGTEDQLWTISTALRPEQSMDGSFVTTLASLIEHPGDTPFGKQIIVRNVGSADWYTSLLISVPAYLIGCLTDEQRFVTTYGQTLLTCLAGATTAVTVPAPPGRHGTFRLQLRFVDSTGAYFGDSSDTIRVTL